MARVAFEVAAFHDAGVAWSEEEHRNFLLGLQKLGKVRARPGLRSADAASQRYSAGTFESLAARVRYDVREHKSVHRSLRFAAGVLRA